MIQVLKQIKQSLEIQLFPAAYKAKFFRTIQSLNWQNIRSKNIENELLLLQYFLKKEDQFIDVGANLGQYLFVAEGLIPATQIYGFEPHPNLAKRLRQLFPKINISEDALSNSTGKTQFKIPYFDNREIHTRGTLKTEHRETGETRSKLIDVTINTLDNFAQTNQLQNIALIKIDVEGAEFDVVAGATAVIESQQPVMIIEIEQRHHNSNIADFIRNTEQQYNYTCYYFSAREQQFKNDIFSRDIAELQSADHHGKSRDFINNFIFVPNTGKHAIDIALINSNIVR